MSEDLNDQIKDKKQILIKNSIRMNMKEEREEWFKFVHKPLNFIEHYNYRLILNLINVLILKSMSTLNQAVERFKVLKHKLNLITDREEASTNIHQKPVFFQK